MKHTENDGHEVLTIRSSSGNASASFAPSFGGIGTSLVFNQREVIYRRPDFWTTERDPGGLPFLFPVCGRHILNGELATYKWNGEIYSMPLHGFSQRKCWTVQELGSDRLVMSLTDDAQTREYFPFSFNVTLDYRISDAGLTCHHHYENHGDQPMPFYAGFHPYFAADTLDSDEWRLTGAWKRIGEYDDTYASIRRWAPMETEIDPVPAAKKQNILESNSFKSVELKRNGQRFVSLMINAESDTLLLPYLQLYRSNNDPFICLEPWMGLPNGLNEPDRIPCLLPKGKRHATFVISV